jgi:phosphatidylserine/phosphatidylglycerophosphate/cardiolipin synthase-like enzyme
MLSRILHRARVNAPDLLTSELFNELTFYSAFLEDLASCRIEVVIESPFVTTRRIGQMEAALQKLKERKVRIVVNTRDPQEHDDGRQRDESYRAIATLQRLGVQVLYTGGHHRKLAILDRKILYEGSLNILSQGRSSEIMRRIESSQMAWQMVRFVELDKFIT